MTTLRDLTTIRIGGPVRTLVRARSEEEFIDGVRSADEAGTPLLVVGGGSNILASDEEFDGVVVQDMREEIVLQSQDACGGAAFTVTAGTPWEQVVDAAIENAWEGFETLTGIPGSTGATPVQNVGAYGQEVKELISTVRTWDRLEKRVRTFALIELQFSYRNSILKRSIAQMGPSPRYIVLSVSFQTRLASDSAPIRYAELARTLGVDLGARVPAGRVREAVLQLRRSKGMVLEAEDHDTWSAGSFFTNPIIPPEQVPEGAPAFDVDATADATTPGGGELVKTSAAWLISQAGFDKGFSLGTPAALSTKHVLALTNRGGATSADMVELARHVRDVVAEKFAITLVPEPVFVGHSL